MVENILQDICFVNDFCATCLRYFNAARAHESSEIGEAHDPEANLIPNVLKAVLSNESNLKVFGDDYPTPDGTCLHNYVQVTGLAQAHLLSLKCMQKNKGFSAFNLGNDDGFSLLEVIKSFEYIANNEIHYQVDGRRDGHPAVLVTDNELALCELSWNPKHSDLSDIIKRAWSRQNNEKC